MLSGAPHERRGPGARHAVPLLACLLVWLTAPAAHGAPSTAVAARGLAPLSAAARLMVIAPHPDDDVLAAGGLLARAIEVGAPVEVLFVTSGDGYPEALVPAGSAPPGSAAPGASAYLRLGQTRAREARRALAALGVSPSSARFLGFPDGGLASLWDDHWPEGRPYRSPYTGCDRAPYPDGLQPGADYTGSRLTRVLEEAMARFRPTLVLVPHPGDTHTDHAAAGAFAIEAAERLQRHGRLAKDVRVLAYLVHNPMWPEGDPRVRQLVPPRPDWLRAGGIWWSFRLTPDEEARKRAAIREHRTQLRVLSDLMLRFARGNELFAELDKGERARIAARH